jgi:hypothetical protein
MKDINLVGFAGKKRSGKDTAAGFLRANANFKTVSFASSLKQMASDLTDLPFELFNGEGGLRDTSFEKKLKLREEDAKRIISLINSNLEEDITNVQMGKILYVVKNKKIDSWRHFLQFLGTDVIRDCVSKTYWIDVARTKIQKHQELGDKVAVTDVRFKNEEALIRELGGTTVMITRPSIEEDEKGTHISEVLDFNCEFDILNEDINDFRDEVLKLTGDSDVQV